MCRSCAAICAFSSAAGAPPLSSSHSTEAAYCLAAVAYIFMLRALGSSRNVVSSAAVATAPCCWPLAHHPRTCQALSKVALSCWPILHAIDVLAASAHHWHEKCLVLSSSCSNTGCVCSLVLQQLLQSFTLDPPAGFRIIRYMHLSYAWLISTQVTKPSVVHVS